MRFRNRSCTAVSLAAALVIPSCTPSPARTTVKPGQAEMLSEREETMPNESRMFMKIDPPQPARVEEVVVKVRVTLPSNPEKLE